MTSSPNDLLENNKELDTKASNINPWLGTRGLFFSLFVHALAISVGSSLTSLSVSTWYPTLEKPSFNPPGWIFGPVWTNLYMMMGISCWWYARTVGTWKTPALYFYWFHLCLNVLWSALFFGLQWPAGAFVEIIFLWASIAICILLFSRHQKWSAFLLVPYFAWVSFASILNFWIWQLN